MVRKCTICQHQKRKEIDKSLVSPSASFRAISQQYGVSKDALRRHVENGHIEQKIAKVAHAHEAMEADDFLTHIQKKRKRFTEMAQDAKDTKNPHLELKVYQVESKFTELEGKAIGAFKEKVEYSGNVNLLGQMSDSEVETRAREIFAKHCK